jgi:hypothetical protein
MISGYESELYEDALKGWRKVEKENLNQSLRKRTEVL